MSKKKGLIKSIFVIITISLLMGLAVQPGTATVQLDEKDIDKKDFLFQTIIDIANNKDFKKLINQEKNDGFYIDFDYNYINICRNILIKNPRLLSSLFLTKSPLTYDKLELAYEKSSELINTIGEEKALDLVESITITNPKFTKGLSEILEKDEDIKNRIEEIKIMNKEINPISPFEGNPIICGILLMLTFTYAIPMVSMCVIILTLSTRPLLGPFFVVLLGLFSANLALFFSLVKTFCF